MLGFFIGTACLIGLVSTLRRGRCHGALGCGAGPWGYGRHGYGQGPFSAHGACPSGDEPPSARRCSPSGCHAGHSYGFGGAGGYPRGYREGAGRWILRPLFERLDATPGQERVIITAFEALKAQRESVRDAVRATGTDAARAFRGESLDETHLGEAFAKQDAALEAAQKALFDALNSVHQALDPEQRRVLADWMERGTGVFHRWGEGPYRG